MNRRSNVRSSARTARRAPSRGRVASSGAMSRGRFLRTAGVGAAGVGAAMMGMSGVASASPGPGKPLDMYGGLGTGIADLTEVGDFNAFTALLREFTQMKVTYKGTWNEAANGGKTLFQAVGDGTLLIGTNIADQTKNTELKWVQELYWGMPFGMEVKDFISWLYEKHTPRSNITGEITTEMWSGLDIQKYLWSEFNVVPIPYQVSPGESGGWFPEEIPNSVTEFNDWSIPDGDRWGYTDGTNYSRTQLPGYTAHGFQMRLFGLGGQVLLKAFPSFMAPSPTAGDAGLGDCISSKYNAVEFYLPASDYAPYVAPSPNIINGASKCKYYYIESWWDSYTYSNIWINKDYYDSLPAHVKQGIDRASHVHMLNSLAKIISGQGDALEEFKTAGAELRDKWPSDIVYYLKGSAILRYNELADDDDRFAAVLNSMRNFILGTRWPYVSREAIFGFSKSDWQALSASYPYP